MSTPTCAIDWVATWTGVAAVATVATAVATWLYVRYTREILKSALANIEKTKEQIKQSHDLFIAANRPWLKIERVGITIHANSGQADVVIEVQNYGHMPARITTWRIGYYTALAPDATGVEHHKKELVVMPLASGSSGFQLKYGNDKVHSLYIRVDYANEDANVFSEGRYYFTSSHSVGLFSTPIHT